MPPIPVWIPKGPRPQLNLVGVDLMTSIATNVAGLISGRCQALAFSEDLNGNRGLGGPWTTAVNIRFPYNSLRRI
jgi:hypothetical protein